MNATIEVDEQTYRSLEFAGRMSDSTAGTVVARLVADASMSTPESAADEAHVEKVAEIPIYADYEGHRTRASFNRDTARIDIMSGPLAGRSFKSPTGAARAVVAHYKPDVSPNRNGWSFWMLDNGSGAFLQSIRHST
ncbi:hypothetical protein [Kribbella sp. VKM Ac-2566]|uniref:hypothetical protein n=1 Tax=Kribbella sp. VKM Ac-2566 TaxID=2512218 RepID=UPI00106451D3|nr:hypothetical protein [Kribbella sp. VKM Ac-2566]TDW98263.1 hypothetical protein EV647_2969 [Kribbella sp. VKM Ac-2566]